MAWSGGDRANFISLSLWRLLPNRAEFYDRAACPVSVEMRARDDGHGDLNNRNSEKYPFFLGMSVPFWALRHDDALRATIVFARDVAWCVMNIQQQPCRAPLHWAGG